MTRRACSRHGRRIVQRVGFRERRRAILCVSDPHRGLLSAAKEACCLSPRLTQVPVGTRKDHNMGGSPPAPGAVSAKSETVVTRNPGYLTTDQSDPPLLVLSCLCRKQSTENRHSDVAMPTLPQYLISNPSLEGGPCLRSAAWGIRVAVRPARLDAKYASSDP